MLDAAWMTLAVYDVYDRLATNRLTLIGPHLRHHHDITDSCLLCTRE